MAGRDQGRVRTRKPQSNPCVGSELLSETDKVRVWIIRLAPGERIGFHRHVLNYFWTSVNGGRGRQHLMDGTTVEHSYFPGETRHETYGPGEFKVHDLENLGDKEMIFNTIEFLDSANKPLPVPDRVRLTPTLTPIGHVRHASNAAPRMALPSAGILPLPTD